MNKLNFIIFFFLFSFFAQAQKDTVNLTLKSAELLLFERNLTLIAEKYNIDIAEAQIQQAKLFENPTISLEQNIYNRLNNKYFDVGKNGEAAIEIEQAIHLAGQRKKQIKLEKINKDIAQYQFEEALRILYGELNEIFIETYFLQKTIKIYDKEIISLENLLTGMKIQLQKGNISFLEISRLESMLLSLKKEKNEQENSLFLSQSKLNQLLNITPQNILQLTLDENALNQINLSQLSYNALKNMLSERSDIKTAYSSISASLANLKLQKSMAAPDFSVKGMYDRAGNFINNYFALGISISIPIFNRNQGNIKSARLNIHRANKEKEYIINKAESELFAAYNQLNKAIELYQSINKNLEKNFDKLIIGTTENFKNKNISLLEFIDYYKSYKESCLQFYETQKSVFLTMENLNTIVGKNIFTY